MFYLLIWRNVLNKKFFLKKKWRESAHPIRTCLFPTYLSHLCAILCNLCPWHLCTFICTQVNPHNDSYICLGFFLFLFFLSLHYVFAFCIIYTRFFFNKCLCQRSALLHLNTQHSTKSVYRYVMICTCIYVYVFRDRLVDRLANAKQRVQWMNTAFTSLYGLYGNIISCDLEECVE